MCYQTHPKVARQFFGFFDVVTRSYIRIIVALGHSAFMDVIKAFQQGLDDIGVSFFFLLAMSRELRYSPWTFLQTPPLPSMLRTVLTPSLHISCATPVRTPGRCKCWLPTFSPAH